MAHRGMQIEAMMVKLGNGYRFSIYVKLCTYTDGYFLIEAMESWFCLQNILEALIVIFLISSRRRP